MDCTCQVYECCVICNPETYWAQIKEWEQRGPQPCVKGDLLFWMCHPHCFVAERDAKWGQNDYGAECWLYGMTEFKTKMRVATDADIRGWIAKLQDEVESSQGKLEAARRLVSSRFAHEADVRDASIEANERNPDAT